MIQPLVKQLKHVNNYKHLNHKQLVDVDRACYVRICLVHCDHCAADFLQNLLTRCSFHYLCIVPSTACYFKVPFVDTVPLYVVVSPVFLYLTVVFNSTKLSSIPSRSVCFTDVCPTHKFPKASNSFTLYIIEGLNGGVANTVHG